MAASIIRVEFDRLKQIARYFEEESEFVQNLHNHTEADLDMLYRNGWRSPSADKFYAEMYDSVLVSTDNLTKALAQTSLTIRQIMVIMANSDEEASAIIENIALATIIAAGSQAGLVAALNLIGQNGALTTWANQMGFENLGAYLTNLNSETNAFYNGMSALGALPWDELNGISKTGGAGISALFALPKAIGILTENGFTPRGLELLSDHIASEGLQILTSLNPYGALALGINAAVQLGGSIQSGASIAFRDFVTGGDSSLLSHQMMTEGIETFQERFEDANLTNIFNGVGSLLTDYYVEPVLDQGQSFLDNVQDGNWLGAGQDTIDIITRVNPVTQNYFLIYDQLSDPARLQETTRNLAGLGGDTVDFFTGLGALPSAPLDLAVDMGFGSSQRLIETLPISNDTRDTLSAINSHMHRGTETYVALTNPASWSQRLLDAGGVDFGDQAPERVDGIFDLFK